MRVWWLLRALSLVCVLSAPVRAQSRDDSLAIRRAAADYIEAWYGAHGDRMARALHPEQAKRIMMTESAGRLWIRGMGASALVRGTRAGGISSIPAESRRTDVRILDVFQNAASVRIDAGGWIDYPHLVREQGQWLILNVLWENRRPAAPR